MCLKAIVPGGAAPAATVPSPSASRGLLDARVCNEYTHRVERDFGALVAQTYDRVADRYEGLELADRAWPRLRWLDRLLDGVPAGSPVLDVGCGNGLPATARIAEHHEAVGVDISAEQVERARRNVPTARFLHGDLRSAALDGPFAAIAAFDVIEHVPREEHAAVFARWCQLLEPSGSARDALDSNLAGL